MLTNIVEKTITKAESNGHYFHRITPHRPRVPSYGEWRTHTGGRHLPCRNCGRMLIIQNGGYGPSLGSCDDSKCGQ